MVEARVWSLRFSHGTTWW